MHSKEPAMELIETPTYARVVECKSTQIRVYLAHTTTDLIQHVDLLFLAT